MLKNALALAAAGAGGENLYIEDVFSTYLYTGNSSTQTITNGIDLAGEGGMVWLAARGPSPLGGGIYDSERDSFTKRIQSFSTAAQNLELSQITSVSSNGFSLGPDNMNNSGQNYVAWTFRKAAPKFFDIVTYTGTNSAGSQTLSHSLGSVPGSIIVKRTDSAGNWRIFHRSLGATQALAFTTGAAATSSSYWNDTAPTDTQFTVGPDLNDTGASFVAYLFAHDAGGFGDDGLQNVISCGSFATDGSGNASVTLGYEPQFVITKRADGTGSWWMMDTMRGMPIGSNNNYLLAESSSAEASGGQPTKPNATGFSVTGTNASATFIYIAIRRGPMKTPEAGTEVFSPYYTTSTSFPTTFNAGFPVDIIYHGRLTSAIQGINSRLTTLSAPTYAAFSESSFGSVSFNYSYGQNEWEKQSGWGGTGGQLYYSFRRAPKCIDVVCYTGTGVARTVDHNLGVAPEMIIVKNRDTSAEWQVYHSSQGGGKSSRLNETVTFETDSAYFNNTNPTDSVFTVGSHPNTNKSASPLVAYLFATVSGVSKVGSYTGTGTTLQVNCGFSTGARFVLIKRADSTGDWYVWDTARGIVSGDDPYLLLNSTAAEVTNTDYIDPLASGFEISSTAPAAINASGGSFIFLAIA